MENSVEQNSPVSAKTLKNRKKRLRKKLKAKAKLLGQNGAVDLNRISAISHQNKNNDILSSQKSKNKKRKISVKSAEEGENIFEHYGKADTVHSGSDDNHNSLAYNKRKVHLQKNLITENIESNNTESIGFSSTLSMSNKSSKLKNHFKGGDTKFKASFQEKHKGKKPQNQVKVIGSAKMDDERSEDISMAYSVEENCVKKLGKKRKMSAMSTDEDRSISVKEKPISSTEGAENNFTVFREDKVQKETTEDLVKSSNLKSTDKLSSNKFKASLQAKYNRLAGKKTYTQLKGGGRVASMGDESSEDILATQCELPVYRVREQLLNNFKEWDLFIIKGKTGSGKTTQIPQYIVDAGLAGKDAIAITQPRRVAAISIAGRVAKERCCQVGEEVGYCVRFDDMTSPATKIKYVTDGMLLRESIYDPLLSHYSWIILDEAHERTIHTDVLFGIVKAAKKARSKNKPLKVIVMSATIEKEKMLAYFDNARFLKVRGRNNEVVIKNVTAEGDEDDYVHKSIRTVIQIHKTEEPGDILVFLTGEEEIDSAFHILSKAIVDIDDEESLMHLVPHVLYAALPSCEQLKVLRRPQPGIRKVIFSTNIAETSITIPNIKYVVDSGMVKCRTYSAVGGGFDILKVERVSKAQAKQRKGRAGRESDGTCYRLYTKECFDGFRDFPIPEIQRFVVN